MEVYINQSILSQSVGKVSAKCLLENQNKVSQNCTECFKRYILMQNDAKQDTYMGGRISSKWKPQTDERYTQIAACNLQLAFGENCYHCHQQHVYIGAPTQWIGIIATVTK